MIALMTGNITVDGYKLFRKDRKDRKGLFGLCVKERFEHVEFINNKRTVLYRGFVSKSVRSPSEEMSATDHLIRTKPSPNNSMTLIFARKATLVQKQSERFL